MLITASIIRADGTEGEVSQQAFGFDHLIGIGRIALDDLTDVALTNPVADQLLKFDGNEWVNATGGGGGGGVFIDLDFTNSESVAMYLLAPLHLHSTGDTDDVVTHPYTMLNSGIYVTDANGEEVFRLWASDPSPGETGTNIWNLYLGYEAGEGQTTNGGDKNTGIGYKALNAIDIGSYNTALGVNTLQLNVSSDVNTAIGANALENTTGESNTAIGAFAGNTITDGSRNVLIGKSADVASGSIVNGVAIGFGASVAANNTAVIGNVSITDVYFGSTAGNAKLHADGSLLTNLPSPPGAVPTSRTLTIGSSTQDLSANRAWLGNVTNDTQTKAAVVPNTVPLSGQILVGNVTGTAYAPPVTVSGSGATVSLADNGVLTLSNIANASLSNSTITIGGVSTSLGGSALGNVTNDTQTKASTLPNTAPTDGQIPIGTAAHYAPTTLSGSGATATLGPTGVLTLSNIANASLANSAVANLSGTNTGDQTTVSGNAGTATALQNARTIGGVSFDGTANIVPQTIQSVNEATDTTCFLLFISASGTQSLQPLNNVGLAYNSNTNALTVTTFIGALTGNSSTSTALATARAIYGNNFDGTAALSQIIASTFGGTGNGFTKISGPTTAERTKTMRDANDTVLELGGSYTPTGTFTSLTMVTPVLGTPTSGNLANCTFPTLNQNTSGSAASLSVSGQTGLFTVTGLTSTNRAKTVRDAADTILELAGSYTPTGTWTSLTMVTPVLGTPTSGDLRNCTAATDSVAGVISSADHTTLTNLSGTAGASGVAPTFVAVGFLCTAVKTGVDLKNAGTTTVFTVPTSRTFLVTGSYAIVTAVTSGGAGTTAWQIKESSASRVMTFNGASASVTPVAGQSVYLEVIPNAGGYTVMSSCTAGNSVQIVVAASNAGSTAVTGTVFVTGFYTQ